MDSGVFIRVLRGDPRASRLLNELRSRDNVAITSVSIFEVLRGSRNDVVTNALLSKFDMLSLDEQGARYAADLMRSFRGVLGGEFAVPDALIAGAALANNATLVTLNRRQFAPLAEAGLALILIEQDAADWTTALS